MFSNPFKPTPKSKEDLVFLNKSELEFVKEAIDYYVELLCLDAMKSVEDLKELLVERRVISNGVACLLKGNATSVAIATKGGNHELSLL